MKHTLWHCCNMQKQKKSCRFCKIYKYFKF
nr:MAG TPA: hypothetical protein [Caudoviricetes sp.]